MTELRGSGGSSGPGPHPDTSRRPSATTVESGYQSSSDDEQSHGSLNEPWGSNSDASATTSDSREEGAAAPLYKPSIMYNKEGGAAPIEKTATTDFNAVNALTGALQRREPSLPPLPPPSVGLVNEGTTCYLNSLLQLLFHIPYFRSAVYQMPVSSSDSSRIHTALQELFFQMQERTTAAQARRLTKAFGWGEQELHVQHDIQEMATLLRDNLEQKMKGTKIEGAISRLFEGRGEQVVTTLDKTYESRSVDTFYDIHLPIAKFDTIMDSIHSLTAKDQLVGGNKYRVEEPGRPPEYKDAEKGYEFVRFPPVIFFHLKRFEMDFNSPTLEMKKLNSFFEFSTELDLSELERGQSSKDGGPAASPGVAPTSSPPPNSGNSCKKGNAGDFSGVGSGAATTPTAASPAPVDICGPFSTDYPAVYDLHGVIVHRGSARSGHYYCYIREWDAAMQRFSRWILYDDENVQVVSEEAATKQNFGGSYLRQMAHGRETALPCTHNAYILSYIRRGDCAKVLAPSPTDIIPQHVKDALRREMEEDERRQREELEERKRAVFVLAPLYVLRDHIKKDQLCTLNKVVRTADAQVLEIVMLRTDSLASVYERIADIPELKRLGYHENNCRLWVWGVEGVHKAARSFFWLPTYDECGTLSIEAAIETVGVHHYIRCFCYVEKATDIHPIPVVDVTSLMSRVQEENKLRYKWVALQLTTPTVLRAVEVHLRLRGFSLPCEATVEVRLLGDAQTAQQWRHCTQFKLEEEYSVVGMELNSGSQPVRLLEIRVHHTPESVDRIDHVRVTASPSAVPQLQIKYKPGKLALVPMTSRRVLVFFKLFSHLNSCVSLLGSVVTDSSVLVEDCATFVFQMLHGAVVKDTPPLLFYEERRLGDVRLLDSSQSLSRNGIGSGSVIVAQLRDVQFAQRYLNVEAYYYNVYRMMQLQAIQVVMYGDPNWCHSLLAAPTAATAGQPTAGDTGTGVGALEPPTTTPKKSADETSLTSTNVSQQTAAVSQAGSTGRPSPGSYFEVIRTFQGAGLGGWSYQDVCEFIGSLSGLDTRYLRLYACASTTNLQPCLEPVIDDGHIMVDEFVRVDRRSIGTVFFELLYRPLREVQEEVVMRIQLLGERKPATPRSAEVATATSSKTSAQPSEAQQETTSVVKDAPKLICGRPVVFRGKFHFSPDTTLTDVGRCVVERYGQLACEARVPAWSSGSPPTHFVLVALKSAPTVIQALYEVPSHVFNDEEEHRAVLAPLRDMGLTYRLVPAPPLKPGQMRIPCHHGERCSGNEYPFLFGEPFFVTIENSTTVEEFVELMISESQVDRNVLQPLPYKAMVFTRNIHFFQDWEYPMKVLWQEALRLMSSSPPTERSRSGESSSAEQTASASLPIIFLNHPRPKEKPGSRYVAQYNQALTLGKKS